MPQNDIAVPHIRGYMIQIYPIASDVSFDYLRKVFFAKFLLCKVTPSFFVINTYFWGGVLWDCVNNRFPIRLLFTGIRIH